MKPVTVTGGSGGQIRSACLLLLALTLLPVTIGSSDTEPTTLLNEADRLAWLHNWIRARPLFAQAEKLFTEAGDARNALYCKVGRLRAEVQGMPFTEVSGYLSTELKTPLVQNDPELRLRILVVKGNIDLEIDPPESRRDWEEVLRIAQKLGKRAWAARATGELAIIAFIEGDSAKARDMIKEAVISAMLFGDVAAQIRYFSVIGEGFVEMGRAEEGIEYLDRALGIASKHSDVSFPMLAHAGRARALLRLNRRAEAAAALNQALKRARETNRIDYVAELLVQLGVLQLQEGKPAAAIRSFSEAAALARSTHVYRIEAAARLQLTKLHAAAGQKQEAHTNAVEGLTAIDRVGDRYALPEHLAALADVEAQTGRLKEAHDLYEKATDIIEGMLVNAPSLNAKASFVASMSDVFVQHFLLAAQRMQDRRLAFEVVERARGRITADSLRARVLAPQTSSRNKSDPEQKRIAALQQALIRTTSDRERKHLLAELFEAEQKLIPADGRASGSGVDLRAQPVSLIALQRSLRTDEILLEYVLADPVSFCLAVDRRSSALIPLDGRTRIERQVRAHLKHIRARSAAKESGRELFSALLHPAAGLERKARLIIVPDGILNSLSFDTLVGVDGRYVAESHTISVAPSGTALHLLRAMPTRSGVERALVVGGVQYEREKALLAQNAPKESPDAGTRGMAELRLAALSEIPKTEDEAKAIAALSSGSATLLAGDRATEAMLKAQSLDRYGILHLATHGISDVEHPERAALVLGSDPGAGEDGLLQAREIANLRLRAELVVLSACNTGEGRIEGQEGVANLVRAFFRAGSRTVVASQWPADDTATLALMKEFYGHLAAGKDRGSALADAKRGLISRFGKDAVPFYWGAFTMVGEAAMPVSLKN